MRSIDSTLERLVSRTPASDVVAPDRAVRFIEFLFVGGLGMVLDLGVTFALLSTQHYLVANTVGFLLSVTFNFGGNWWLTYNRPGGNLARQYLSYVGLHGANFGLRAISVALLVEAVGVPASVATLIGVGVAAVANFAGTETIFGSDGEVWFDVAEAGNHLAHLVYSSRLRGLLQRTGLYNPVFRLYTRGVSVANRAPKRTISAAGVEATVATEKPVETVSVLHTLKKERDILSRFVDDVRPDDAVLDVGANLGVFSALAGQRARDVTAVEPHPRTADRCRENLARNGVDGDVLTAAVGAGPGTIGLAVDQDAVGTQRPEIASDGAYDVPMIPADRLGEVDVVKVDVEGAEQHVLDGMARMLAECPPRVIYVEAHDDADARSLRDRLEAAEYRVETVAVANQQYLRAAR